MLQLPQLDDLSYETIAERARARIPTLTPDWTDFNHHDPGVTLLQAFAWLNDSLRFYMNATGEEHRLKYLKLLGLYPRKAAAKSQVALLGKGRALLGRGCKLLAGTTVFEVAQSYDAPFNSLKALWCETGRRFTDLTAFAGVDGNFAQLFTAGTAAGATLYLGFENPLGAARRGNGAGEPVRFYVNVQDVPQRNPFAGGVSLAEFAWDFFDGEDWRPAALTSDETCGFLRSGFVNLALPGRTALLLEHKRLPEAFYLRAHLVRGEYDVLPRVGAILCNSVEVEQTDTLAEAIELPYGGEDRLALDYHVGPNQRVSVGVGGPEGYSLWFDGEAGENSLCDVVNGGQDWQRVIVFDKKRFGRQPKPGQTILVLVAAHSFYERAVLGTTTGTAGQQLATDIDNLYSLRLALTEQRDGRPFYRLWNAWQGEDDPPCDAPAFTLSADGQHLTLGDGVAGLQPPANLAVRAVAAKTSLLEGGNVLAGRISAFAQPRENGVALYNPRNAEGGTRPKTSRQLEQDIAGIMGRVSRAVSAGDYAAIVSATPGLIIEGVAVISAGAYNAFYGGSPHGAGTVLVAVKPRDERVERPQLSEAYRRTIAAHIEGYRLVTTQVRILPARYAPVEVYGRIRLEDNSPLMQQAVRSAIEALIDTVATGQFGRPVVFGRLYSALEMLEGVRGIEQLSLSCSGGSARKTEQGDILVAPDAMTWLAATDIEFS